MSAISDIRGKKWEDVTRAEQCFLELWETNGLEDLAEQSAAELADLRAQWLDAIKANNEVAKINADLRAENEQQNATLAKDAAIFLKCMKLLGLDVSGTDPEAIVDAIEELKKKAGDE